MTNEVTTSTTKEGGKKLRILISEDEKPLSRALYLKLTHAGYDVKCVFDGEETVEALENETYDLLTLDLIIPKMDGFKVLEILKEKGKLPRTIVLSNLSQGEDYQRAKDMGVEGFYVKSNTSLAFLVSEIERLVSATK